MPLAAAPSRNRNAADRPSRRRCTGKSGRPMGSTSRSAGATRFVAATYASATPHSAPNGKSVRPAKATLAGRINPAKPSTAQALSSDEHSTKGELSASVTEHRYFLLTSDFALLVRMPDCEDVQFIIM